MQYTMGVSGHDAGQLNKSTLSIGERKGAIFKSKENLYKCLIAPYTNYKKVCIIVYNCILPKDLF